jgi:membrane-associated phospholipid phosphatase
MFKWIKKNPHAYWALLLPYIIFLYFLPEYLVTDNYWVSYISLDDLIPFFPPFVVFYCLWFPMLFFTGLWLLLRDGQGFKRFMVFCAAAYTISAAIFILFPNGQDLRPAVFESQTVFTRIIGGLYAVDTNTNVLPSMHVVLCVGVMFCICGTKTIRLKIIKPLVVLLNILIILSTVFIKQHSVLDIFTGLPYGALIYGLTYILTDKILKKENH